MADELSLPGYGGAGAKAPVAQVVGRVDWFLVELGEQDVRDGVQDTLRSAFEQIGEAGQNLPFAQTDTSIQRSEAPEAYVHLRHGRTRPQCPVLLLKDIDKVGAHQN